MPEFEGIKKKKDEVNENTQSYLPSKNQEKDKSESTPDKESKTTSNLRGRWKRKTSSVPKKPTEDQPEATPYKVAPKTTGSLTTRENMQEPPTAPSQATPEEKPTFSPSTSSTSTLERKPKKKNPRKGKSHSSEAHPLKNDKRERETFSKAKRKKPPTAQKRSPKADSTGIKKVLSTFASFLGLKKEDAAEESSKKSDRKKGPYNKYRRSRQKRPSYKKSPQENKKTHSQGRSKQ